MQFALSIWRIRSKRKFKIWTIWFSGYSQWSNINPYLKLGKHISSTSFVDMSASSIKQILNPKVYKTNIPRNLRVDMPFSSSTLVTLHVCLADTWRNDKVINTSWRSRDVVITITSCTHWEPFLKALHYIWAKDLQNHFVVKKSTLENVLTHCPLEEITRNLQTMVFFFSKPCYFYDLFLC